MRSFSGETYKKIKDERKKIKRRRESEGRGECRRRMSGRPNIKFFSNMRNIKIYT